MCVCVYCVRVNVCVCVLCVCVCVCVCHPQSTVSGWLVSFTLLYPQHTISSLILLSLHSSLLFLLIWEGIDPIVELVVQVVRTVIAVVFCGEIFLRVLAAGQRILKKKKELIEMSLVHMYSCTYVHTYVHVYIHTMTTGYSTT